MDERYLHLFFSYFGKIPAQKFSDLVEEFGSPKKLFNAIVREDKHFKKPLIDALITFQKSFSTKKILSALTEKHIVYIPKSSRHFPPHLKLIPDCPIGIFVKGNIGVLTETRLTIAIVGTRLPTSYGRSIVNTLIQNFPSDNIIIVSGLAYGIDKEAHMQAISHNIPTIAVLAGGVDHIYPATHRTLYNDIIASKGAIISEHPPGTKPTRYYFLERNRIIVGLSQAIVIVEGSNRSGTLVTARFAAEYDRPVFSPPHPINSPLADAPHFLLKQGAILVTSATDILDYFHIIPNKSKEKKITLSEDQKALLLLLQKNNIVTADDILEQSNFSPALISKTISELELLGVIAKNKDGTYHQIYEGR